MLTRQKKEFISPLIPRDHVKKNVFRLLAALCLFLLVNPIHVKKDQEPLAVEHGIGGGSIYEESIPAEDAGSLEPELILKRGILLYNSHVIQSGDYVSALAANFGLNQDTIISANKITNSRLLQVGRTLKIPNQDGVFHAVKNGETLDSISESYKVDKKAIQISNELFSENVIAGKVVFIPGARLDWVSLQEINGDLFIWPVNGAITSPYGYRIDPFNSGRRLFHTGMDIRGSAGTPIRAAMAGRVSQTGYDNIWGNYVIINHHSGYRTLYAHMSVIRVKTGANVIQGERIGDVGSTGLSTGPHLHFMVYKNGVTVNPRALMR